MSVFIPDPDDALLNNKYILFLNWKSNKNWMTKLLLKLTVIHNNTILYNNIYTI